MSRVLVALLAVASTGCLPLADIRPDTVDPEATDLDAEARGRALLEAAADAHGGLAAWQQKQTTELIFRDEWRGLATLMAPWPSSDVRANIVQRTRTFDSVVTFQDGAPDGLVWGIEAWKPWVDDGSGRQNVEDSDIRFMLPTTQYFVEMPFRMLEAELVRDAGPVTVDGVTYDTVYATWGGWSANEDYDQYVIYLDPQTHRWAKVAYTVREIMRPASAIAHFDQLKEVEGIWIPHRMRIGGVDDPADAWMHVMTIEAMRFDAHDRNSLTARAGVPPLQ